MSYTKSDALKNDNLSSINTRTISGHAKLYTGSRPTSPQDAATGTLLVDWTLDATPWGTPSAGAMALADTPLEVNASASGTAGYLRFESSGGAGVIDLTVTITGGGGDVTMANLTITNGEPVRITSLTLNG